VYVRSETKRSVNRVSDPQTPSMVGYCDMASTSGETCLTQCMFVVDLDWPKWIEIVLFKFGFGQAQKGIV
jgi:hypothetical protein